MSRTGLLSEGEKFSQFVTNVFLSVTLEYFKLDSIKVVNRNQRNEPYQTTIGLNNRFYIHTQPEPNVSFC